MKGNKILATLIVMAMVLSTMVVLNIFDVKIVEKAGATTPGVDIWGNVSTTGLEYDADTEVDITIDTSGLTNATIYYLYYPYYYRTGSGGAYTYNLTWQPYMGTYEQKNINVTSNLVNQTIEDIKLNRSGMWVFAQSGVTPTGHNATTFSNTVDAWFWVNMSTPYTITVSPDEVYYGKNETITVTVKDSSGDGVPQVLVEVRREPDNDLRVYSTTNTNGQVTFSSDWLTKLTYAGNYTVVAYVDKDITVIGYTTTGWNNTYGGNPSITADYYTYTVCGAWDPPEYNTTHYSDKLVVNSGVPTTSIPVANNTMYWSFDGEVNISVKDYDNNNISGLNAYVFNSDDENVTLNLTIDTSHAGDGYMYISNNTWGKNGSHIFGENGTWYAYIFRDTDSDGTEEWNCTVEWTVAAAPGLQIKLISPANGEISAVPAIIGSQPTNIQFQVINASHGYYGDGGAAAVTAAKKNITISGDALFLSSKTLYELPSSWSFYSGGTWTVNLTPTMAVGGGTITISADWSGEGTASADIDVGGTNYLTNGTVVSIEPTEFVIDKNVTLTVTVTDAAGDPYKNADIWLCYVKDDGSLTTKINRINLTSARGTSDGKYTFFLNKTQQTTNQSTGTGWSTIKAPRNISAYVELSGCGYGYAVTKMKPKADLKVTVEPSAIMAGQKISKLYFNTTVVDSSGNTTGYPKDSGLNLRVYNSTGDDVTTTIGSLSTADISGKANKTATNEYIQKPGTYTVYAYNNTHTSEGYNATLVVTPVDVSCDTSEFIWNVDKNISATFTVKYNGELINGTLRIDNLSVVGSSYNKTWANCSFAPTIGSTAGADASGNTSKQVTITNGVVTINNITANYLPGAVEHKNITFYFKSKTSGSAWARCSGVVSVKIPDVSASPASIPYNKPAELEITVTGRGTGLEDVWVSIEVPGISGEMNTTTGANGKVTFAFTPPTTGDVTIAIENRTSTTKVKVTSWSLYLDVVSQVDEDKTFTVIVRNSSATGSEVAGATVTFNGETKTSDYTFTAPSVTANRDYIITATKEGYALDTATITVLNVPALYIQAVSEINAGATLTITVYSDTGTVNGATVTIGTQTGTTLNGEVKLTAPDAGDYTITVTKSGYETKTQPITVKAGAAFPGFEALTLIAAIGVAFILLRRRRH